MHVALPLIFVGRLGLEKTVSIDTFYVSHESNLISSTHLDCKKNSPRGFQRRTSHMTGATILTIVTTYCQTDPSISINLCGGCVVAQLSSAVA